MAWRKSSADTRTPPKGIQTIELAGYTAVSRHNAKAIVFEKETGNHEKEKEYVRREGQPYGVI